MKRTCTAEKINQRELDDVLAGDPASWDDELLSAGGKAPSSDPNSPVPETEEKCSVTSDPVIGEQRLIPVENKKVHTTVTSSSSGA